MTHAAVLVPLSLQTYNVRRHKDVTRPRLLSRLSLDAELASVYAEPETRHALISSMDLPAFLVSTLVLRDV